MPLIPRIIRFFFKKSDWLKLVRKANPHSDRLQKTIERPFTLRQTKEDMKQSVNQSAGDCQTHRGLEERRKRQTDSRITDMPQETDRQITYLLADRSQETDKQAAD
jgi:hypothetical protein